MVPRVSMNGNSDVNGSHSAMNGEVIEEDQPSTSGASLDSSYVAQVGETVGISNLDKNVLDLTAADVTFIIRRIIAESLRFAHHSRRVRLVPDDVDSALKQLCIQPQYGFKTRNLCQIRMAGSGGRDLFVEENREVELEPIFNAPAPKMPANSHIRSHWLAIDGEQPAVPENPVPEVKKTEQMDVCQSDDIPEDNRISLLKGPRKSEQVNLRTTTTHTLSLEQQVFFKEVMEAIMGGEEDKRTEALHALRTDGGLQPLLGRFAITIAEGVKCNIIEKNLAFLIYLMRTIQSLHKNATVNLEKHLHELFPAILSCILNRQLCTRPEQGSHWALREFASRLIVDVSRTYQVADVQSRIIRALSEVWNIPNPPFSTLYGSIYALNEFGLETVKAVLLPRTASLYEKLNSNAASNSNLVDRDATKKLIPFITKVLIDYVKDQRPPDLEKYEDYVAEFGGFADSVHRVVVADMATRVDLTPKLPRMQNVNAPLAQSTPRFVSNTTGRQQQYVQRVSGGSFIQVQGQQGRTMPGSSARPVAGMNHVPATRYAPNMVRRPMNVGNVPGSRPAG